MKKDFKEYYELSDIEIKNLWKEGIFIFDTNILFSLYRLDKDTKKKLIEILEKIKKENRIWTPHQVLEEYHKNRRKIIIDLEKDYESAKVTIRNIANELSEKTKGKLKSACENHPLLNTNEINNKINSAFESISKDIENLKSNHPPYKENDINLKDIENIFSNYGESFSKEELEEILKDGEIRFENKTPPGYKDNKKSENKYGDLIVWKQILEFSKTCDKPICFITNDDKEDWWIQEYEKPSNGRFELKKEIYKEFSNNFEMYTLKKFMEKSKENLGIQIKEENLENVEKIRENRNIKKSETQFITSKSEVINTSYKLNLIIDRFLNKNINLKDYDIELLDKITYLKYQISEVLRTSKDKSFESIFLANYKIHNYCYEKIKKNENKFNENEVLELFSDILYTLLEFIEMNGNKSSFIYHERCMESLNKLNRNN